MAYIVPAYIVLAYIAMNQALVENLFVVIICILNKIPIFVVGKPGSSKTLTMQVIGYGLHTAQLCRRVAQIVMAKPGSCKTLITQVISQLWPLQLWPGRLEDGHDGRSLQATSRASRALAHSGTGSPPYTCSSISAAR